MTKTELLSTYTAEQLAEMVVGLKAELSDWHKEKEIFKKCEEIEVTLICPICNGVYSIELSERQDRFLKGKFIDKIKELKEEAEKYRKAFEDAKKERDCQIAKYQKKIEELTAERDFISKDSISVHQEPIDIAKDLINAEGEYEHNPITKKICGTDKGTYRIFDASELRQIAEHLLVYCNHNGEVEE